MDPYNSLNSREACANLGIPWLSPAEITLSPTFVVVVVIAEIAVFGAILLYFGHVRRFW